jgi:hypothetical protein
MPSAAKPAALTGLLPLLLPEIAKVFLKSLCIVAIAYSFATPYDYPTK